MKPDQPELTLALVQTLFAARRDEEAEGLANHLIERQKTFGPIYDALYLHYMRSNRGELAERVLLRKVNGNPREDAGLIQLAFHYFMNRRPTEMQAAIARVTSDPKTFPDGRLKAGDFYVRIHDYPAAVLQYEKGKNSKRFYRQKMAEVLATQGARDGAEKIVAGLLKDNSEDPEALALHATLMLASGDPRQVRAAIAVFQPLVAKMPRNATLHFNLGRAFLAPTKPGQSARTVRNGIARRSPSWARETGLGGAGAGARRTGSSRAGYGRTVERGFLPT